MRNWFLVICCLSIFISARAMADDGGATLSFTIETNRSEYELGVPILLKMKLQNDGTTAYNLISRPGLGREIGIMRAYAEEDFRELQPDMAHADTDLGGVYLPVYDFRGQLKPEENQCILHMLDTGNWRVGKIRLKAVMLQGHGRFETPEITVTLLARTENRVEDVFTPQTQRMLYHDVVWNHNDCSASGGYRSSRILPLVEKAIRAEGTSLELEYALYDGVLMGVSTKATISDLNLIEQAGQAFLERFPESWLRAQVCAILAHVNLKKAEYYANTGRVLPESHPLYEKLSVPSEFATEVNWADMYGR